MDIPEHLHKIALIGVGCCGHNAVGFSKDDLADDVDLFVFDTDSRGMISDDRIKRIAIGNEVTRGFSAGAIPDVGKQAAIESLEELKQSITGYDMVFITGGLGGGTATGCIPIITEYLNETDTICVAVITTPFDFEGKKKERFAQEAIDIISTTADSCIIVSNQKLLNTMPKNSTLISAFEYSNQVLKHSIVGIYSLITTTGYINLDFADVKTVMLNAGPTVIGYGEGIGEHRIKQAVESALMNPLLEDYDLNKAKAVLINITADQSLRLDEIHQVGELLTQSINSDIPIIIGTVVTNTPQDDIKIYTIFSGVKPKANNQLVLKINNGTKTS